MRWASPMAVAILVAQMFIAGAPARAVTLDAAEADLLGQVNSFRASKGLPTLVVSETISAAARWLADDMAARDYFSHTSVDGRSPQQRMADAGYPAYTTWTGEDLAAGYPTASQVLAGWIASPAHYAVLTNPVYRAIGIGRAYSSTSRYGWYWAADFGGVVDGARVSTVMPDGGFRSSWAGQTAAPTLSPGQLTTLVVALRNTGWRGWYAGVPGSAVALATSGDVARPDLASGWLSSNRIAGATTSYVAPGQTGWFSFQVRAPAAPGVYRLDVRAVVDGVTWLEDQGIYFTITVR